MNLSVEFTLVEETPLLQPHQRYIAFTTATLTMVIGILVNIKVFKLLWIKQRNKTNSVINKLYLTYNVVSLILHPPLLVSNYFFYVVKQSEKSYLLTER